ncbi:hypothetical protein PRZ48_002390 [Zasmidium cellare]|uniref:Uncharacterized protein n=1 Tax=Zasmidium cellare TaxID=395010 RepID=A0ABR0F3X6_ZASCE|nr:hypothetical protein PRZ48_002390 [Zasmidium cellare]
MLAGPMLAALLMPHGLLLPLWTGVVMIVVAMPLLSLVPAQRSGYEASPSPVSTRDGPLHDYEQIPLLYDDEESTDHVEAQTSQSPTRSSPIRDFFSEYTKLLRASRNFRLLLLAKFLSSFASSSSGILALYITLRTSWAFAEVGYIYTLKGIINILLAAVVVPAAARFSTDRNSDSSFRFNLISTKLTLLVSIVGAVLVALAATKSTIIAGNPNPRT